MKILAIGPYVGNLEQEITTFRPYTEWLSSIVDYDEIIISTHHNRMFLYSNFIKKDNIIPIYQMFSRDELKQNGFIHEDILQKDYNFLIKNFKDDIIKLGYRKKDIENVYIKYRKITVQYPIHNKKFSKIEIEEKYLLNEYNNKILYIPYKINQKIYYEDVVVVGGIDCGLKEQNVLLNRLDYYQNGLKYLISLINNCKGVITPLSYYTLIANLQGIPVLSWGEDVSVYREGGMYNFGNKKCRILPTMDNTMLVKNINTFIEDINNGKI